MRKKNKKDILNFLLLTFLWVFMSQLVNPVGDFPLDDDWNSGLTVYHIVQSGEYRITPWMSSSLIAQAFWGALFCIPFGFSFTCLRFSTLVLGLIGVFFVYGIIRKINSERSLAFIGALIILTNPLFFVLSHTFRTDIPFFTMAMASLFFFITFIEKNRKTDFILAILFSILSALIRQPGVVIPIAFFIVNIFREKVTYKAIIQALLPMLFTILTIFVYQLYINISFSFQIIKNPTLDRFVDNILSGGIENLMVMSGVIVIYLGLFILPFIFLFIPEWYKAYTIKEKRLSLFVTLVSFLAIMAIMTAKKRYMPLWGNTLIDVGLGPLTLRDTFILDLPHWPRAPFILWMIVSIFSVLGSAMFLQIFVIRIKRFFFNADIDRGGKHVYILLLCMLTGILYCLLIVIAGIFDRYIIFLIPLAMVIIASNKNHSTIFRIKVLRIISVVFVILYAVFAVAGTHDYFSWNRARWKSAKYLMKKRNVPFTKIDGGYEFNGWFNYDPNYITSPDKSWWWVKDDKYIISFGPIKGHRIIGKVRFQRWLDKAEANIYILEKVI